jgi:CheY-like chemotaxis protein
MSEDQKRFRAAGMDDFVAKPVTKEALLAAFARIPEPGADASSGPAAAIPSDS